MAATHADASLTYNRDRTKQQHSGGEGEGGDGGRAISGGDCTWGDKERSRARTRLLIRQQTKRLIQELNPRADPAGFAMRGRFQTFRNMRSISIITRDSYRVGSARKKSRPLTSLTDYASA